jgi:signal transduction histidine kinase
MNAKEILPVLEKIAPLVEAGACPYDSVLQELADLFGADALGLHRMDTASPELIFPTPQAAVKQLPWHTDAELLNRLRFSLTAETHQDGSGAWLICLIGDQYFVWARRPGRRRAWSAEDRWAWLLASQALVRRRQQAAPVVQRQLEQAAAVTGRLCHDFSNHLTGILGFTELSMPQVAADTVLYRYLQEVLQSARNGAAWVHRLHFFCRRDFGPCWPTPLACVLAEEETRVRSAGAQGLRWLTELPDDLPLLDIDADALHTVIGELVDNARQAGTDQTTVTFTARTVERNHVECAELLGAPQPGAFVELILTDDGPGMSTHDHAKLFRELFFSTRPKHRGLGLLVVYGIIQRYHGGMCLPATTGQGMTVKLYLPVASVAGPDFAGAPRVLLVSAKPVLRESIRHMLESRGCRITATTSPQTALAACQAAEEPFALVVSDVQLPQMSGFDLARRVLSHHGKTRFLFLHMQPAFHGLGEEELAKRYPLLRMPLEPRALMQAVDNALAANGAG